MPSLQTCTFAVRDDRGERHDITFERHASGRLSAACTCVEGRAGRPRCSHARRLLEGDATGILSGNELELEVLEWWVACLAGESDRWALGAA